MTNKECILSIFRGEDPGKVVWQPRIENWYDVNKVQGTLPARFEDKELIEIYDELNCVPRPYLIPYPSPEDLRGGVGWGGFCPQEVPPVIKVKSGAKIKADIELAGDGREGDFIIERWQTPKGSLTRKWLISDKSISQRVYKYPIENLDDLDIMEYILQHQEWEFDLENFQKVQERIGDRAVIAAIAPRAPFPQLHMFYMGYENTVLTLHKHQDRIEKFLQVAEEADNAAYEAIKESPVKMINLPDNIDAEINSPPLFKRYILPHYRRRAPELKDAGKFVHAHWDGCIKNILKFAKETRLDGLEALTPKPQGDATIDQIKEGLGKDMILLDGIPAIYFLPSVEEEKLVKITKRLLEVFAPNIVLGISDELPADGRIERVELVSEIVENYNR